MILRTDCVQTGMEDDTLQGIMRKENENSTFINVLNFL